MRESLRDRGEDFLASSSSADQQPMEDSGMRKTCGQVHLRPLEAEETVLDRVMQERGSEHPVYCNSPSTNNAA